MGERPIEPDITEEAAGSLSNLASAMYLAHQHYADRWLRVHYGLGIPSVALAAVAGTSALSDFDRSNLVAGSLALVVAVLTSLLTWLNPQETGQRHARAAQAFLTLSLRARRLRQGFGSGDATARKSELESLTADFDDLTASSPNVSLTRFIGRAEGAD
jgi:hypothetical protein